MPKALDFYASVFSALADPTRLRVFSFIKDCRSCVAKKTPCAADKNDICCLKDIVEAVRITAPTVSHHIKELVDAKLVVVRKKGKCVYCAINEKTLVKTNAFLNSFL